MNMYGSSNVTVRLALANMKKKKKNMITTTLFILLAAMTLGGALTIINQMDHIFQKIDEAQNVSDFCTIIAREKYLDEFEEFILNDARTESYEKELALYMEDSDHTTAGLQLEAYILDIDEQRTINTFLLTDGFTPEECEANGIKKSEAIYIPVQFKSSGCEIGSDYAIRCKGNEFHFTLAGYYESALYARTNDGNVIFYVTREGFDSLRGETQETFILKATLKGGAEDARDFVIDFKDDTSYATVATGLYSGIVDSAGIKENINSNVGIGAASLAFIGIVVMVVVLVVICSEISENIRDSYQDIGVLEAMGYHSRQIAVSYLIQYGAAAAAGSVIGALLSGAVCNLLSEVAFTMLLGFHCSISADFAAMAASVLVTVLSCVLCVLIPVARIRKCTILTALRGGIETHSFKGNFFPLHKGGSGINTRMGLKNLFTEKRQNFMIGLVVFLCMVLFGLSVIIYNTFKDMDLMLNNSGIELSDLQVVAADGAETAQLIEEITALPEFRKAFCSDLVSLTIDGKDISGFVTADYSLPENIAVFEGDAPVYENEIVLSENLCTLLGKGIGDKVKVSFSGVAAECFITGKCYMMVSGGEGCYVNESLMKLLKSDYKISSIDLYFSEGVTEEQAIEALSKKYKIADREKLERLTGDGSMNADTSGGKYSEAKKIAEEKIALLLAEHGYTDVSYSVVLDGRVILSGSSEPFRIKKVENAKSKLSANLMGPAAGFFVVSVMVLFVSIVLTAGILSMMVRNRVSKKKCEYGVFKSMGYTTLDLMKQNAFSYAVSAFVGALFGVITVFVCAKPLLDVFFLKLLGSRVPAVIDSVTIIGSGLAMVVFVFGFAMLCSRKIKKISVYSLMTE